MSAPQESIFGLTGTRIERAEALWYPVHAGDAGGFKEIRLTLDDGRTISFATCDCCGGGAITWTEK